MQIAVATANFYYLPFEQTLEIIAQAGYEAIELDLYWERKEWGMAQHLKGRTVAEIIRSVRRSGLRVTSIHDGGGVIETPDSIQGFINPRLSEYLDCLGYAPQCIVFHPPHIEGQHDLRWWQSISPQIEHNLAPFRRAGLTLTLENLPVITGYSMPLTVPQELLDFTADQSLGVTLDTTHYAQNGDDIVSAAQVLKGRVTTIHLGDYRQGKTHVFIGDGELDFAGFFRALAGAPLQIVTLECSAGRWGEDLHALDQTGMVERLKFARQRVQFWLS